MLSWPELRVKRLRNRVTKTAIAERLGCATSWLNALEGGHYRGPAREKWAAKYDRALSELIEEKHSR